MSIPLPRIMLLLGLVAFVDSASIPIESGGISPDIGKSELLNAKELIRREVPKEKRVEAAKVEEKAKAEEKLPKSLVENEGTWHHTAAGHLREYSEWSGKAQEETGYLPPAPGHHASGESAWSPKPPKIYKVPHADGDHPIGYWKFGHDEHLKHGHYAANHWHAFEHKGGPPHFGVSGHWALNGGHAPGEHEHASEMNELSVKDRMKLRNGDRRNPSVPAWDQTWPPADGQGYKYHGHWAWHDQNDYKHPDWVRPEEIMSKGNAALGPGRWAWNWQHQNEIWKPMPPAEYAKWRDHIDRVSPTHVIYETSADPICAQCAGGCALPGVCEWQGSHGLSLKQFCMMKEGKLCQLSYPGVKPPEEKYAPAPAYPPAAPEANLGAGYWDDSTWVHGHPSGQPASGH